MVTLKKIIFYTFSIFFINTCSYSYVNALAGKGAAREGLTAAGNSLKVGLEEASKNMAEGMKDSVKITTDGLQNTVKTLTPVLDKVGPAFQLLSVAYTVGQLWGIGKDVKNGISSIHSYYNPSKADIMQSLKIEKEYNFLTSEKAYKDCLIANFQCQRSTNGIPSVCEERAKMFAMAAGNEEADKITEVFKKHFTK